MIKRTIYFGNPVYLSLKNNQLVANFPKDIQQESISIPIEDIGMLILDEKRITITQALLSKCIDNTVAIISCDDTHLPNGLFLPLVGNAIQTQIFKTHTEMSSVLKKQLWQQTVKAKLQNQIALLDIHNYNTTPIKKLITEIKSGDTTNCEAQAAIFYWKTIFPMFKNFSRNREGLPPNNLLNYGYAILRGIIARSIVCGGLHPTIGIFHRNKYNPYCLADDLMEPYRVYVDKIVLEIISDTKEINEITKQIKSRLFGIQVMDVLITKTNRPLMLASQQTISSFVQIIQGTEKKIDYPKM